jgi:hypothetical protein
MPVIPALERLGQEDLKFEAGLHSEFEAILCYIARFYHKTINKK